MSPLTSNGASSVGTGQGGAVSSLFDLCTGHVASSYLRNPSPTANLHVDMLKPARSIPGCFLLEAWIDSVDGKKVLVKGELSSVNKKGERVICDVSTQAICGCLCFLDIFPERSRVHPDVYVADH